MAKAAIENCRGGRAAKGETLVTCSKKSTSFDKKLVDFYSSRKAWYVITACRVWNCRKAYVIFGLITSLPTVKLHTSIADYIHAIMRGFTVQKTRRERRVFVNLIPSSFYTKNFVCIQIQNRAKP